MKPGEADLLLEAQKHLAKDPALLKLVQKLRRARREYEGDDEGSRHLLDAYDKAYDRLFVAIGKKMDAEGERQAQQFPRRET